VALADTNALTTLALVKGELGIADATTTYDTVLERMILAASDAIARFCRRDFRKATVTEKLAGSGTLRLVLARTPLVSITSITDDGTTIDDDEYEIEDAAAGIVVRDTPWTAQDLAVGISIGQDPVPGTGKRALTVVYISGYVLPGDSTGTRNLPYDVEEACILTAVALYRRRGQDRSVVSEQLGDAAQSYATGAEAHLIPAAARAMLARYRRVG
jgi:hypothetical protein